MTDIFGVVRCSPYEVGVFDKMEMQVAYRLWWFSVMIVTVDAAYILLFNLFLSPTLKI